METRSTLVASRLKNYRYERNDYGYERNDYGYERNDYGYYGNSCLIQIRRIISCPIVLSSHGHDASLNSFN